MRQTSFAKSTRLYSQIQVLGMKRTIEVSHWGNIAVEETYHMKHVGAELQVTIFIPNLICMWILLKENIECKENIALHQQK